MAGYVAPHKVDHSKTLLLIFLLLGIMVGLVLASESLYRIFCQVTGYGGTTQTAEYTDGVVLNREMTVRFNADVNRDLPWNFKPVQQAITLKIGEEALVFYQAVNHSDQPITGTATFNVTPFKAAQYFVKIDCFCFTEQTLAPGQEVDMPVTFFVDPALAEDARLDEIKEITLSYTFFEAKDDL